MKRTKLVHDCLQWRVLEKEILSFRVILSNSYKVIIFGKASYRSYLF